MNDLLIQFIAIGASGLALASPALIGCAIYLWKQTRPPRKHYTTRELVERRRAQIERNSARTTTNNKRSK